MNAQEFNYKKKIKDLEERLAASRVEVEESEKRVQSWKGAHQSLGGVIENLHQKIQAAESRLSQMEWVPVNEQHKVMRNLIGLFSNGEVHSVTWREQLKTWTNPRYPDQPTHVMESPPGPLIKDLNRERFEGYIIKKGGSVERDRNYPNEYVVARTTQDWKLWNEAQNEIQNLK
jgi:hypothetical protein